MKKSILMLTILMTLSLFWALNTDNSGRQYRLSSMITNTHDDYHGYHSNVTTTFYYNPELITRVDSTYNVNVYEDDWGEGTETYTNYYDYIYTESDSGLMSTTIMSTGDNLRTKQDVFTDNSGKIISDRTYSYYSGDYHLSKSTRNTYDNTGKLTTYFTYTSLQNEEFPYKRFEITYYPQGLRYNMLESDGTDSLLYAQHYATIYTYTTDAVPKPDTEIIQRWDGTIWVSYRQIEYVYTDNDQHIDKNTYAYSSAFGWDLTEVLASDYQDGRIIHEGYDRPTWIGVTVWEKDYTWEEFVPTEDNTYSYNDGLSVLTFPNPFREKVSFVLPDVKSQVEMSVYNVKGQLLISKTNQSGNELVWDGKSQSGETLTPGIYIVRLKQTDKVKTVKLVKVSSR